MGKEQLEALVQVLRRQLELGPAGVAAGTWAIRYDKESQVFFFEKCEFGDYCEERPAIIALDGTVRDAGGPLLRTE